MVIQGAVSSHGARGLYILRSRNGVRTNKQGKQGRGESLFLSHVHSQWIHINFEVLNGEFTLKYLLCTIFIPPIKNGFHELTKKLLHCLKIKCFKYQHTKYTDILSETHTHFKIDHRALKMTGSEFKNTVDIIDIFFCNMNKE